MPLKYQFLEPRRSYLYFDREVETFTFNRQRGQFITSRTVRQEISEDEYYESRKVLTLDTELTNQLRSDDVELPLVHGGYVYMVLSKSCIERYKDRSYLLPQIYEQAVNIIRSSFTANVITGPVQFYGLVSSILQGPFRGGRQDLFFGPRVRERPYQVMGLL